MSKYLEPKIDIVTSEGLLLFSHPSSVLLLTVFKHAQIIGKLSKNEQNVKTNLAVQIIYSLGKLGQIGNDNLHQCLNSVSEDRSDTNLLLELASAGIEYKVEQLKGLTTYQQTTGHL